MSDKISRIDLWVVPLILAAAVGAIVAYQNARTMGRFAALVYPDEGNYYLAGARELLAQGLDWYSTPRSLWNGPINPLWIAIFGANAMPVKVVNLILFALAGLAVWDTARRLFGRHAAYLALGGFVLYLPFYEFTPTLLTEPLFIPLIILAIWLVVVGGAERPGFALGSGLALGAATLVRPTLQLYPLVLVGIALIVTRGSARRQTSGAPSILRPVLIMSAGFAIFVVPYVLKNVIVLDRPVIANGFGAVLYLGNDLRKGGYEPVDSRMMFDTSQITSPYAHFDTEGDQRLFNEAMRRIQRDPFDVIALQPSKFLKLTYGSPEHYFRPQGDLISFAEQRRGVDLLRIGDLVLTVLIVSLGGVGLVVLPLPRLARTVMVSLVAYVAAAHTVLFPIPRMFLPAMPILMVFAGGLLTRGRRSTKALALSLAAAVGLFIAFEGAFEGVPTVSAKYVSYFDPVVMAEGDAWAYVNDAEAKAERVKATGPDPYVVFDVPDFEAELNQMIFITMAAEAAGNQGTTANAQVFWRAGDGAFSENQSESFAIALDGADHTYAVSPSFRGLWEGMIDEIRVDLPQQFPDVEFRFVDTKIKR